MLSGLQLVFLFLVVRTSKAHPNFPSFITQCYRNDQMNQCLLDNAEKAKEYMKDGIPELYMPSLDPFMIKEIVVPLGKLTVKLKDYTVYNAHNYNIKKFEVDLDDFSVTLDILFPFATFESKYSLTGELFLLKLDTAGAVRGNISDLEFSTQSKGKPNVIDGKTYFVYEHADIKLNIKGKVYVDFGNIFPGRLDMSKVLNDLINENIARLTEEYRKPIQAIMNEYIKQVFEKLFKNYSIEDMFPNE